jgi:hypothetical protein
MNIAQKAICDLMITSAFNEFNPEQIVEDLTKNEDKWLGFIWGNFECWPLLALRDIDSGSYSADTLWLRFKKEHLSWMLSVTRAWSADELTYYMDGNEFIDGDSQPCDITKMIGQFPAPADEVYMRLWWD